MFRRCYDITEFDFSNFDTSEVTNMWCMFFKCTSLTSLNITNFNTSQVTDMSGMIQCCHLLTSLDLSNFDTSNVLSINAMFQEDFSLTSLNISNFDISKVTCIHTMFEGCINLEYINLHNFNEINLQEDVYFDIFGRVPDNVVICINEDNNINKILPQIKSKTCHTIDCSNDWKSKQRKIIFETNICINNCNNDPKYIYEYNGKCYEHCINGYYIDNNNIKKCKCELNQCLICPPIALSKNLCTKCNNDYYPKENDSLNIGEYINCYKNPEGYYLDIKDSLYKKCYHRCERCEINGNNIIHNCLKCNINYPIEIKTNNYTNCYQRCPYYFFIDKNQYYCTFNFSCPDNYPILIEDKMQCIYKKIEIKNMIQNIVIIEKNKTKEKEKNEEEIIKYYDQIIEIIESGFTSEDYDTSNLDKGKDEIIETEKMTVTFTTTQNQKSNNINSNITTIDLGECEIILRREYNITENETLYMQKKDIIQEGMNIPKIEYDVYSKLSGKKLEKLNLTICSNTKVSLTVPIIIKDNLDKLNSKSGYYNDICYTTTSESGTDISLRDRKKEFINKTVCQDDCDFSNYNYTTQKANCSCKVKQSSSTFSDMNINKTKLYENFINVKNIANLNLLSCYKILFSKVGLIKNIGSYIIILILIIHIVSLFIFFLKNFNIIKNKIKEIAYSLQNYDIIKDNKKGKNKNNNKNILEIKHKNNKNKSKDNIKSKNKSKDKKINRNHKPNNNEINNNNKKNKKPSYLNIYKKSPFNNDIKINYDNNNIIKNNFNPQSSSKRNIKKKESNPKTKSQNIIKKVNTILKYKDAEMNSLNYDLALLNDKRYYCQYYISLLKTKHNFIFSFFGNDDYNSKIIKIDLFFVGFTTYYTVNALFFDDDTMHKIYETKGSYNFEYQLPKIIYSSLISIVLNIILKLLALSNDTIIKFKNNKTKNDLFDRRINLESKLRIKFILYFVISFAFLLFFWYYISMFGTIYQNTQFHLLKDTLISFGLSLLYPFGIYLLPGIFRIPALANHKKKKECLYKFSKLLQFF